MTGEARDSADRGRGRRRGGDRERGRDRGAAVPAHDAPADDDHAHSDPADGGRALVEVVFLAVLILIPTVYLLACVMRIQAATFAVTQGARDAARVLDFAPSPAVGVARAEEIAAIALVDQRISADGMDLRFIPPGGDCVTSAEIPPSLTAGDVYDICVVAVVSLPGVPSVVTGSRNTVAGVFTMHVGDFREGAG